MRGVRAGVRARSLREKGFKDFSEARVERMEEVGMRSERVVHMKRRRIRNQ
jgi:hypothetical protein